MLEQQRLCGGRKHCPEFGRKHEKGLDELAITGDALKMEKILLYRSVSWTSKEEGS